jgi:Rod binding domain-containing protein
MHGVYDISMYQPVNTGINSLSQPGLDKNAKNEEQLKSACNEFEAVLTSIIVKEGLNTAKEMGGSNSGDSGGEKYNDLANEQIAYYIGRQGTLGLGNMLFQSMKQHLNSETNVTQGNSNEKPSD